MSSTSWQYHHSHTVLDCASTKYHNSIESVGHGVWKCCRKMQFSLSVTLLLPLNLITLGAWDLLPVGACNTVKTALPSLYLPKHNSPFPVHRCDPHIPRSAHKHGSSLPSLRLGEQGEPPAQHHHFHPGETRTCLAEYCG